MEGKRGCASKLLYQIRSTLEKKGINLENLSMKKCKFMKIKQQIIIIFKYICLALKNTNYYIFFLSILALHIQEMYSPMKFKKDIPSYDNMSQDFFEKRLQTKTIAQKEINMRTHLGKFEEFKKNEDNKIMESIKNEEELRNKNRNRKITQQRNEGQRFHIFQQKHEQNGIDDWKSNMLFKKEREKKDLDYQLKEAQKYQTQVYNSIKNCQNDMMKKIENFEQVLQTTSNQNDVSSAYNLENEHKLKIFLKSNKLSEKMKADITEKIMLNPTTKRERDRRRRKIIVEQGKAQLEIENKRREEHLTQKLNKQSNQERQINYESWRVEQNKYVVEQNRRLRDLMYEERYEMEMNFFERNEEEFLKFHKDNIVRDIEKEKIKKKDLEISLNEKIRLQKTKSCRKMVDLIVDIAEVTIKIIGLFNKI